MQSLRSEPTSEYLLSTLHPNSPKAEPKKKKIYAFEPSRKAHTRLQNNLEANLVSNVVTFNCAVGDATQITWFYEPEGHLTNGSLVSDFAGIFSEDVKRTPVLMMHAGELGQLLDGGKKILIKIDAEGYEGFILEALQPVISAYSPDLIVEFCLNLNKRSIKRPRRSRPTIVSTLSLRVESCRRRESPPWVGETAS